MLFGIIGNWSNEVDNLLQKLRSLQLTCKGNVGYYLLLADQMFQFTFFQSS